MTFDPALLHLLRTADSITVLTGAGVSAESGIPTFRDAMSGLWAKFNPAELATPQAFERDAEKVTRWYDQRRCDVMRCQPNSGHVALARLQTAMRDQGRTFRLLTQNVDELHQAAGSSDVIELHGSLALWRCTDCGAETREHGPPFETYPPRCPCGGRKRPGVVWFGEGLPREAFTHAQRAASASKLFMSLGTSAEVYPAAGLIDLALSHGAKLLEINPQRTPYSDRATWSIRGRCGEILPELFQAAEETRD